MANKNNAAATPAAAKSGDDLSPATTTAASGALMEPEIAEGSVIDHPAVDANPRAGVPVGSNQIDFNDPTLTDEESVVKNLSAQGAKAKSK